MPWAGMTRAVGARSRPFKTTTFQHPKPWPVGMRRPYSSKYDLSFEGIQNRETGGMGRGLIVRPIMSYGNRSSGLYAGWLAARVAEKTEEPTRDPCRCT